MPPSSRTPRKRPSARPAVPPVAGDPPPDEPPSRPSLDDRVRAMTMVDQSDVIAALTDRLGRAEQQKILDGIVITRLIQRICELEPDDPVAADAAEQQRAKEEKA